MSIILVCEKCGRSEMLGTQFGFTGYFKLICHDCWNNFIPNEKREE